MCGFNSCTTCILRNIPIICNTIREISDRQQASSLESSLDMENEKELNWQKAYENQKQPEKRTPPESQTNDVEHKFLNAQQPNHITLKEIVDERQPYLQKRAMESFRPQYQDNAKELESSEKQHLLGVQKQQHPHAAGESIGSFINDEVGEGNSIAEKVSTTNKYPEYPLDNWASNAITAADAPVEDIDSKVRSNLEMQNNPKEMTQSDNNKEQNGSTIILTQTSAATAPPAGAQSGYNGSGADSDAITCGAKDGEYKGPKIWHYLVKNYPVSSQILAILLTFVALWALGYILLPEYAVPSTVVMRIALLFVGAQTTGILVAFIHLPDMLGMLAFGVLYANVGLADFEGYAKFEGFLREMALTNIMLLAGLGLDANAFKKLWFMILRLTLVPTIAEVSVIAVLAYLLLNMPWLWGILLGLVITAVSPNVVVTVMLKLKEDRLGLNSGIHTLIYAMTTCNDVVAIFVFGVINGVIFSTGGTLTQHILQGPIGIGIGIVYGYLYGLMLQYIPSRNSTYVNGLRLVLTTLGGAISVMGSKTIKYPSAGALGCVTVAFIAGMGWKGQEKKLTPQQKQANENGSVAKRLDLLWKFLKPVSFALIGKEINFAVLDGKVVGYGALLVLLGSLFRLAFAYISTYGGNLTRKERAYITISGFPKATVQAALGPIALDVAREIKADGDTVSLARNVLIISVLAIIFPAPLGAILMVRLAPKWLKYSPPPKANADDDISYGNVSPSDDNTQRVVPI